MFFSLKGSQSARVLKTQLQMLHGWHIYLNLPLSNISKHAENVGYILYISIRTSSHLGSFCSSGSDPYCEVTLGTSHWSTLASLSLGCCSSVIQARDLKSFHETRSTKCWFKPTKTTLKKTRCFQFALSVLALQAL